MIKRILEKASKLCEKYQTISVGFEDENAPIHTLFEELLREDGSQWFDQKGLPEVINEIGYGHQFMDFLQNASKNTSEFSTQNEAIVKILGDAINKWKAPSSPEDGKALETEPEQPTTSWIGPVLKDFTELGLQTADLIASYSQNNANLPGSSTSANPNNDIALNVFNQLCSNLMNWVDIQSTDGALLGLSPPVDSEGKRDMQSFEEPPLD